MLRGDILDSIEHPNQEPHRGQRLIVVQMNDRAYLVPCIHEDDSIVLKTIIPSRKATRKCLEGEPGGNEIR